APLVDVAHGDQLKVRVAEHPSHVPVAHDADADGSDVDSIAGGLQTDSRQYERRDEQADALLEDGAATDRPLEPRIHRWLPLGYALPANSCATPHRRRRGQRQVPCM